MKYQVLNFVVYKCLRIVCRWKNLEERVNLSAATKKGGTSVSPYFAAAIYYNFIQLEHKLSSIIQLELE